MSESQQKLCLFDKSKLLEQATPGTDLHHHIVTSSSVLSYKLLVKYLKVDAVTVTFLNPSQ